MELIDETAVVTGAGQGIGLEVALALARNGANMVLLDINSDTLNAAARKVEAMGRQALALKCDVSSKREVEEAARIAFDRFHSIYVLVNNAGKSDFTPIIDLAEEVWDRVIDINLKSVFLCTQAFGKYMIQRGKGRIVNIASVNAQRATAGKAAYSSAKAGVMMLTKATAIEWAKFGIRANSISPGTIETERRARMRTQGVYGDSESKTPVGYMGKPQSVADTVVFLASSGADYITGTDIAVDGGVLAIHPRYA